MSEKDDDGRHIQASYEKKCRRQTEIFIFSRDCNFFSNDKKYKIPEYHSL